MRKIVIGKTGSGKTREHVEPSIRNYAGKVIWVSTVDDTQYLNLQDSVKVFEPKELKELNDFDKIEIVMGIGAVEEENKKLLMDFLNKYFNEKLLMVFDEACTTLGEQVLNIIKNEKVGCDKLIVLQSMKQIEYLVSNYVDKRNEIYDLETELSYWEIINLDFHHVHI